MKTTKLIFLILGLIIVNCTYSQQAKTDTLNNESIIQLTKIGLEPSVIAIKIKSSINFFDVSTNGLIELSKSGVAPEVINEMMKYETKKQEEIANYKDLNDPKTFRPTGIYYYNPANVDKPIRRVDPTVVSSGKSGGLGTAIAQSYTYGLASNKLVSIISGAKSKLEIDENSPVFYFYFEQSSTFKSDNWFFATATSPNEFVMVKLKAKKDSREVTIGSSNAYGSQSGISSKDKIPFEYTEEAPGIFKVFFKRPIDKGEYCFTYASSNPSRYSNDKVFDFSITNSLPK